ncbi:MAG: hypothetical protein Q7S27_06925 [Nanoarchaeota archaeon]|nr:hypothetical protein [Nanoarchaeota archaeon]
MKKRAMKVSSRNYNSKSNLKWILIAVVIVVALIAVYLIFSQKDIGLSPLDQGIGKNNILSVYQSIGKEICKGQFKDVQGNVYTQADIDNLMDTMGDNGGVLKEFCGSTPTPTATRTSSPSPTSSTGPTLTQSPAQQPTLSQTPKPTASPAQTASTSPSVSPSPSST